MPHPPLFNAKAFDCPWCGAYAQMEWIPLMVSHGTTSYSMSFVSICSCGACARPSIWRRDTGFGSGELIYPGASSIGAPAHEDLPSVCSADYEEARAIASVSPRAAAALLRLCVQKICAALGEKGDNINTDIGSLVRKGLPVPVKEALDIVRVTGNEAVHPGTMSPADHAEQVNALFTLVNMIVDVMIAQPARIAAMHAALPAGPLAGIAQRDAPKNSVPPT